MDTQKNMKFYSVLVGLIVLALVFPTTNEVFAQDPIVWRDEFDGPLAEGWAWMNENPNKWTFENGNLRIFTSPYGTGGENLLLRPVAAGDFSIETRVFFEPDTNFQLAGLVLWQDQSNFISFGRAFCDIEGGCVGSGIYFDKISNGEFVDGNFATEFYNPFNTTENYLRLERRGNMVRALYSHEGITWTEIGIHWLPDNFQVNGVGIQAAQDFFTPDWDIPADFDYFEMTEGWGFLPEGFHDYDSGDVPNWNCGVGGWATDPDDRLTDVAIEVGIDGTSLPYWLYASDYREDLYNAGVCEDGNCSFSMSLWDVISPYEPHNIVTYAQDLQNGEWVQLSNSPKTLTCRTYDIYGYNPQTGTTQQLTNIRDAGEFNPSFSPNGKWVAHDVVAFDGSQSIYITDLTTGTSTPLSGAEAGGNDAAFSPNGKWVLFDTAWTDTPNLYIVPVTGGTPTLVRENGIAGDWAPSGKRIVFQDMDGSIRTIPIQVMVGTETILVPSGQQPVWSPDGNWVAYMLNGDIWKIAVNVQGTVQSEPIQLTFGPRWDEQPTWAMDSATVIFHAGMGTDYDLWSVPATGGDPVWLTGAVEFGDFDPAGAKNSANVAYASFSPEGQAPRTWVSAFTYDLPSGYWSEGTHAYHFEFIGADPSQELSFDAWTSEPLYDGKVLLRPFGMLARSGDSCDWTGAINPALPTQFHIGWTADGTYTEALNQLAAMMPSVVWDGGSPVALIQHEVFPFTSQVDWGSYVCSYTYP